MPELRATVRLQLHAGFDLHAAAAQAPYYRRLGVSHLYLSPIAQARPGSMHGYDVIDPTVVSSERGGEEGLRMLAAVLRELDMGAILDIVPNHMAADAANPWWRDVLRHGEDSRYARYFDIDWASPASPGRLWLPWLQAPLDTVLMQGALRIERNDEGQPELVHDDWRLPLADGSVDGVDLAQADALRGVLDRQHYRLAWWRSSADVVNYRRFFDIDGLAALDMRCSEAFDAVHALPLRLLAEGVIQGLRIDHVDGLADPSAYLQRLREAMDAATPAGAARATLHVEKILRHDERLPADWPVDGTTGYEMMDCIGAVQHDAHAERMLALAWRKVSGRTSSFALEERLARYQWLRRGLRADFGRCLRAMNACLGQSREAGDYTEQAIERACADVLAQMPVYRTYVNGTQPLGHDANVLSQAFETADRYGHPTDAEARQWLRRLLVSDTADRSQEDARAVASVRRRFEQLCAPLAAKAVEDTAFYRYGAWLARNEVGSDPTHFALDVASFHRDMQRRAATHPLALSATATHDHKRGEDVRARLAALSEEPERWIKALSAWIPPLRSHAGRVSQGDLAMLLQTLVGAWPLSETGDLQASASFVRRVQDWWIKALREARLHTHWTRPDEAYEEDAKRLLSELFEQDALRDVRDDVAQLAHELDVPGALNGLVAVTLRHTLPGVPDLYQACEYWDQSLVDPDNRADVDYAARRDSLQTDVPLSDQFERFRDGVVKQQLIQRLLAARSELPQLFSRGNYQPWMARGPASRHVLAFTRRHGDALLLVAVPRHCMRWTRQQSAPRVPQEAWLDTWLPIPQIRWRYTDLLGGRPVPSTDQGEWFVGDLFAEWPVAVMYAQPEVP